MESNLNSPACRETSGTIGVLLDSFYNYYYQYQVCQGIISQAGLAGMNALLFAGGALISENRNYVHRNFIYELVSKDNVDGVISLTHSIGSAMNEEDKRQFFNQFSYFPIVSIGKATDDIPSLLLDNYNAMLNIVSHCIAKHKSRTPAFLRGPESHPEAEARFRGYQDALKKHGLPYNADLVIGSDMHWHYDRAAFALLLGNRIPAVDTFICSNDHQALAVIEELTRLGKKIPSDYIVTGFDDLLESQYSVPALTTIDQPLFKIGQRAVDLLLDLLNGESVRKETVIFPRIKFRDSCGCREQSMYLYTHFKPGAENPLQTNISRELYMERSTTRLLDHISKQLKYQVDNSILKSWIEDLAGSFFLTLENPSHQSFFNSLARIIMESQKSGINIEEWDVILFDFFRTLLPVLSSEEDIKQLNRMRRQIIRMLYKLTKKQKTMVIRRHEANAERLNRLYQKLITSFNVEQLNKNIEKEFPAIPIPFCYICTFAFKNGNTKQAEMWVSLENNKLLPVDSNLNPFPARYLIPGKLRKFSPLHNFFIVPLHVEAEKLGYVIFSGKLGDRFLYEGFAIQLSTAVKGIQLSLDNHYKYKELDKQIASLAGIINQHKSSIDYLNNEKTRIWKNLAEEQYKFRVTMQAINDAVIFTNGMANVTFLNPAAEKITGCKDHDVRNQSLKTIIQLSSSSMPILNTERLTEQLFMEKDTIVLSSLNLKNRVGQEYTIDMIAAPVTMDLSLNGANTYVFILQDKSQVHRISNKLHLVNTYDTVTGFYTQRLFEEKLISLVNKNMNSYNDLFLGCLKIDQYNFINISYGIDATNALLNWTAKKIRTNWEAYSILGRLDGEKLGFILKPMQINTAVQATKKLCKSISNYIFEWQNIKFNLSASIGLVEINKNKLDINELLNNADRACYQVICNSGNNVHVYHHQDKEIALHKELSQIFSQIPEAIDKNRFDFYKQNICPLKKETGGQNHLEILLRMIGTNNEIIAPDQFIHSAEKNNIMYKIDRWVISTLFAYLKAHYKENPEYQNTLFCINLSGSSFNHADFLDFVLTCFTKFEIPYTQICFEITETIAVNNLNHLSDFIKALRKEGCKFAIDDFGSGWASFDYLKSFPAIDFLKIDGSFISNITTDDMMFKIVQCINEIAHIFGARTIAEYVADKSIYEKLKTTEVDFVQGYYINEPEFFYSPGTGRQFNHK